MSHYSNRTFICPFFKRDEKNAIFCEGGKIYFPEQQRCQMYATDFCGSHNYVNCTVAKMLLNYYKDKENNGN